MLKIIPSLVFSLFFSTSVIAGEITVSAAASLTDAFSEMKATFEKAHPGITVTTNYAASNPLLVQIMKGAPVDVFASADQEVMDKAKEVIIPETRRDFARNELVLIVPKGYAKPEKLEDLLKMERIAIGDPASVPAGKYAKAALLEANLWHKLENRFVNATSVRQALDYVSRCEVDAGFVYATDARKLSDKVNVVMAVPGLAPIYPIAVITTGTNPKDGQEFVDFVLSPQGQEILAKYDFSKP